MSHSDLAARRGEPSHVWRAGQERRYQMIARWTQLDDAEVLVNGTGVGLYAAQIGQRNTARVSGIDIEFERVQEAQQHTPHTVVAAGEHLPYRAETFDTVLSHEVIEHVADDEQVAREIIRVLKPGGRLALFCPNRWYPFETHGHYWRGTYHFGNTPLINYLPDPLRDHLVPHVRAYTARRIRALFSGPETRILHHERIFGGYDNILAKIGNPARHLRDLLYTLEGTPLDFWALSHFMVVEKRRTD